ncbi:MAG TPA: SDR family NAD(P)-dependent oxidoreductase [Acidimicrobiales bacterium]|jgi:NAD(P)-dependent dehydrogenase (short-subunit alcohol dehydrogenase family)|nr:SDR family NAD(P)-dependent oxidoreductase [Acidimicrobiales bacterium]
MSPDRPLSDRVVLVTGASRGIGEAIARRLAREGAAVAVTARTVEEGDHRFAGSITSTVRSIRQAGGTAIAVPADLSRSEDREQLVETVSEQLGPIDVLVNNAAITYYEPSSDFNLRHWQLMFDVQVLAAFHLSQLVIPGMRAAGAGWIVNISSRAAFHPKGPPYRGGPGTVYGMCKAAIERFTTGLASELYDSGIAVNVLSPSGLVITPGVVHHGLDKRTPKDRHEPVEFMAEAAFLLCSCEPASLTGRITYSQDLLAEFGVDVGA